METKGSTQNVKSNAGILHIYLHTGNSSEVGFNKVNILGSIFSGRCVSMCISPTVQREYNPPRHKKAELQEGKRNPVLEGTLLLPCLTAAKGTKDGLCKKQNRGNAEEQAYYSQGDSHFE